MASSVVLISPPDSRLDPNDQKYKCCCNSCHVETGCIAIGTLEGLSCLTSLVTGLAFGYITWPILGALGTVLFLVLFFVGLCKRKAVFLIPHMVMQVLWLVSAVVGLIVLMVCSMVAALALKRRVVHSHRYYYNDDDVSSSARIGFMVGAMIALLLVFALQIWFFKIVLACYHYFRAVEAQLSAHEISYIAGNHHPKDYPPYPDKTTD